MLTMWDEFTTVQGSELGKILASGSYPPILAKRVAATSFLGLSLTTRFDTSIEINPTTPQALALREWYVYQQLLFFKIQNTYSHQILSYRSTSNTTSIKNVLQKDQHHDTLSQFVRPDCFLKSTTSHVKASDDKEQIFWLEGHIKILEDGPLPYYIGCDTCNKRVIFTEGITFKCLNCGKKNAITTKRYNMNVEITDHTGALAMTIFTHEVKKLLRILQTNAPIEDINCTNLNNQFAPMTATTAVKIIPPNYQGRNETT
ncbi:unnamed protein product [Cuscuta campestris]|uniref:Replication factor A C-terminal domain-containing protein n=1 Tax=Cuscuta campestris TaxID=132261 RepID=A0A484NC95_9ASTE|nr:unnamed protein product [Cuscuta campestris]